VDLFCKISVHGVRSLLTPVHLTANAPGQHEPRQQQQQQKQRLQHHHQIDDIHIHTQGLDNIVRLVMVLVVAFVIVIVLPSITQHHTASADDAHNGSHSGSWSGCLFEW